MLNIISRIVACYEQVYRPTEKINEEICWAFLNFLNKIGDFHQAFEEIGRYYLEEFGEVVFEVTKVLDFDIKKMYKKMSAYMMSKIECLEE